MAQQVITFHYELKNEQGKTVESSRQGNPLSFLEGVGQIIPGLEQELLKLSEGQSQEIFVPYQEAYGPYDQTLVVEVPRKNFPVEKVKSGDVFQVERGGQARLVTVVEVKEETVTVDANHPMAGKNLAFSVEVVKRRDATPDEIAHGHSHDEHGGHAH